MEDKRGSPTSPAITSLGHVLKERATNRSRHQSGQNWRAYRIIAGVSQREFEMVSSQQHLATDYWLLTTDQKDSGCNDPQRRPAPLCGSETDQRRGTLHPGNPPLPFLPKHEYGGGHRKSAGAEHEDSAPAPTKALLRSSHWSGRPNNHLVQRG